MKRKIRKPKDGRSGLWICDCGDDRCCHRHTLLNSNCLQIRRAVGNRSTAVEIEVTTISEGIAQDTADTPRTAKRPSTATQSVKQPSQVASRNKQPLNPQPQIEKPTNKGVGMLALVRRIAPRSVAVVIARPSAEGAWTVSVMKKAMSKVILEAFGVKVLTTRVTKTGSIRLKVEAISTVVGDENKVGWPGR